MEHPGICPHCGAEVPEKASACANCGSDSRTGWSDVQYDDSAGMDDAEYADALRRTFGGKRTSGYRTLKNTIVAVMVTVMLIIFILQYVF